MSAVLQFPDVKKRRISDKDWQQVEQKVKKELSRRQTDAFRKSHEKVWAEVDRQVYMKAPKKKKLDPNSVDWHSAIELGELAKSSEIITADVMRLIFPNTRSCFESHVELPPTLDPNTGKVTSDSKQQIFVDGTVRAFMAQQHIDFGLKARMALSVKEALHHGSYVAEARQESAMMVHEGSGIQSIAAPVWVPHSMWNCYPDPSPSVIGANMLYTGSMIIREYLPRYKLEEIASRGEDGWMTSQIRKVPKKQNKNNEVETDDIELIKYFGDCVINRNDGDIFLPNSKVILANGIIVFYAPNKLPFSPIIYNGYERLDVRDPYFTSPLIKNSPMHKVATVLANKFLDGVALWTEKPIIYDGNDPSFVMNGGPVTAPGSKTASKGSADFKTLEVGDPSVTLQGLQFVIQNIKQGTGGDASRAPLDTADKTATEARNDSMRGEVRIVDFVDKLEFSFKTFLYMQHEINKQEIQSYTFYNPEMDAPDFMRMTRQDLPENIHFDVVGSKGVLGEENRSQKMSVVTAFISQTWPELPKKTEIAIEMYQDAGVKNPERLLNVPTDEMAEIEQRVASQYEEKIQMLEADNFGLRQDLAISKAVNDARVVDAQIKAQTQAEVTQLKAASDIQTSAVKTGLKVAETTAKLEKDN